MNARSVKKWGLKAVNHLFTSEELSRNTLEQSSRTLRGCLSPTRTKLLKDAMIYKYNLTDGLVIDQKWIKIKEAVNSKGRTMKRQLLLLFNININQNNQA
jgi:hypothetical protein